MIFIVIYHLWSFIIMIIIMLCYHSSFIIYLYLLCLIFLPYCQLLSHDVLTHNIDMSSSPTSPAADLLQMILHPRPRPVPFKSWCKVPCNSTGSFWLKIHLLTDTCLQTLNQVAHKKKGCKSHDHRIRKNFRDILSKSWYSPRFFVPSNSDSSHQHEITHHHKGDLRWS